MEEDPKVIEKRTLSVTYDIEAAVYSDGTVGTQYWSRRDASEWREISCERVFPPAHRALAKALYELALEVAPKPEEPTGLGAVVVDACGDTWVRVSLRDTEPWQHRGERRQYKVINAAKVLSEGVTS